MNPVRLRKVQLYELIPGKPISDILGDSIIKLKSLSGGVYTKLIRIADYRGKGFPLRGKLDEQHIDVILQHLKDSSNIEGLTVKLVIRYHYDDELLVIRTIIDKDRVTVLSRRGVSQSAPTVVGLITDALVEHKAKHLWIPEDSSNPNVYVTSLETKNIEAKDILNLIDITYFNRFRKIKVYLDYSYTEPESV